MINKFPIMVIATVSSGKSTLINSLLGGDILPAKNEACTAKAFFIANKEETQNTIFLHKNNGGLEKIENANYNDLAVYNDTDDVDKLFFAHKFIGIENEDIILIDTPGINNSQNEAHSSITYELINQMKKGIFLYVINATQIGIDDDRKLMKNIVKLLISNKNKLDVIFAVNKVDEFDLEKENLADIFENIKNYIYSCVDEGDTFLTPEQLDKRIIPISALTAKIIRKELNNSSLTRLEKKVLKNADIYNELKEYQLEKYVNLPANIKSRINDSLIALSNDENDFYKEILIHTGIPVIEAILNEYFKNKNDSKQSLEF